MGWKNLEDFDAYKRRRSKRRSDLGRALEGEVEEMLKKMQDNGLIAEFLANAPNSREDREGKDFTVVKIVSEARVTRHFGVTISPKSWRNAKSNHPDVPHFCWPIGTNRETMERRILDLFVAPRKN